MGHINTIKKIKFPFFQDERGNLNVIEGKNHIPFDMKRIYYIHNVPEGIERAAHAHIVLEQVMIAISGSFCVTFDDGFEQKDFCLDNPEEGLYIPPMMWRVIKNFSTDGTCLVLASRVYEPEDYIFDYCKFQQHPLSRACKQELVGV